MAYAKVLSKLMLQDLAYSIAHHILAAGGCLTLDCYEAIINTMPTHASISQANPFNPWKDLPKPLIVQAPMEDVTDTVFRQMLAEYGRPDIFFTEFTNVDGIFSAGQKRVIHRLKFNPAVENPIIAQIWGHNPENYYEGAKYVRELGFQGIDINMGCPQRDIVSKGLCGALIGNHTHAAAVIEATLKGAAGLPVSVKTRIGIHEIVTEEWINFLLDFGLAAITVHGRTVAEKSRVPCHWDEIGKAVQVRNARHSQTVIIGNGDVQTRSEALEKAGKYGVDGVMIGRALMDDIQALAPESEKEAFSIPDRKAALARHIRLFEKTWTTDEIQPSKRVPVVKKYISMYIKSFDGARELRARLMDCTVFEQMCELLDEK